MPAVAQDGAAPAAPAAPVQAPAPAPAPAAAGVVFVKITTSKGDMLLELDAVKAPISVDNFMKYVKGGFYDGTVVHRIVPGFVVQGGGFDQAMVQKQTNPAIKNEWKNGLKNGRGTISMARLPSPDTATSQFFLNLKDNPALDGANGPGYAVFGRIVVGLDVLDAMGASPTMSKEVTDQAGRKQVFSDVPVEAIVMTKAVEIDAASAASMIEAAKAKPAAPAAPAAPAGDMPAQTK
ncbi:MAG: peptidylprolyl isomerase A [Phycisphaerales bacterium]|nr:peptidylprolyl isomerase A [Phycisphaerales bacterium]